MAQLMRVWTSKTACELRVGDTLVGVVEHGSRLGNVERGSAWRWTVLMLRATTRAQRWEVSPEAGAHLIAGYCESTCQSWNDRRRDP